MIKAKFTASNWAIFLLATILPLLTLLLSVIVMSGPGGQEQAAAPTSSDDAGQSFGIAGLLIMLFGGSLVVSKLAAIAGVWRRWYFTWVFHVIEIQIVIFVMGLMLVVFTFSADFSLWGLVKLLLVFVFLYVNIVLRQLWSSKSARERFFVSHYSRAHHSVEHVPR